MGREGVVPERLDMGCSGRMHQHASARPGLHMLLSVCRMFGSHPLNNKQYLMCRYKRYLHVWFSILIIQNLITLIAILNSMDLSKYPFTYNN